METKCNRNRMDLIRRSLNFGNYFAIDFVGFSGGLAMLWSADVDLQVQSYSNWHINASVKVLGENQTCHIIGFYGHMKHQKEVVVTYY